MRPALSAREIASGECGHDAREGRFNEARAFCAGNQVHRVEHPCPSACFNEARAFCAGNRQIGRRGRHGGCMLQ